MMSHKANPSNEHEYPDPETVLAIRGAIKTGMYAGPMGEDGHWLNEFWQIGRALRDHADALQAFQMATQREVLRTTEGYLDLARE
ncbi:hypothetical protein [Cupriavidus basilensis]|uniref:hypothetical protein n=1 Tax=Cupriavidus basilensis TaxID=68895 RepID=UPI000750C5FC|nr:hypothetical protein [Cupriavidus basilensis]